MHSVIQVSRILTAHQKGQRTAVQFMPPPQKFLHLLHILPDAQRFGIFSHRIFRQPGKILFQSVLCLRHNGQRNHRAFRHHVHQGIDIVAPFHFACQRPRFRWATQALDRNGFMRQPVKPPDARVGIRHWRGEPQAFGKVITDGEIRLCRGFITDGTVKIGFCHPPIRRRIKMTQQPTVDLPAMLSAGNHTGRSQ